VAYFSVKDDSMSRMDFVYSENLIDIKDNILPEEINTNCILGRKTVYFDNVSSTNDICKKLALEGEKEGLVVVSDSQSQSRGRMGRNWVSEENLGIYMSVLLRPEISMDKISAITLCAAVAVNDVIKDCGIECSIKWPNDIVANNKKICGILTEMMFDSDGKSFVIVGIGVNVNNKRFDEDIKDRASSLYMLTGKMFRRQSIIKAILERFDNIYKMFVEKGFVSIKEIYENNCINIGKNVTVIEKDRKFEAYAKGIDNNGELIVIYSNGREKSVLSGEVSVRGVY